MIPALSNALFISDLHLMEDRPDCIRAFFRFLEWIPEQTDALFILGDFFEYWVGDDVELPYSAEVSAALAKTASEKQLRIYFMAGNRDFALGSDFCERSDMTLIDQDEITVHIADRQVLLSHGDLYCTADKKYLRFRKVIRHPWVMKALLSLSKKRRIGIAESLRESSRKSYLKQSAPVDVTSAAISGAFHKHKADILVHGHTHLADIHLHEQSPTQPDRQRMVLGDWHDYGWYGRIDNNGPTLHRFSVKHPDF